MGYAEGLMSTGERIVHREKQHWFVFIWGARYTILAIIIAGIGAVVQTNLSSPWREILGWAAVILFIGGLLLLGWTILRYMNQEYVLTNRRVIEVEGVLNKRVTDSSLEKVNDESGKEDMKPYASDRFKGDKARYEQTLAERANYQNEYLRTGDAKQ